MFTYLSSVFSCCSTVPPPPPVLLPKTQSSLIGQLTRAWASTPNNNIAALLNLHLQRAKLAAGMSWSYWLLMRRSGAVFFVGERSFCWCELWPLLTFESFYIHKNLHKTPKERRGKNKHNAQFIGCWAESPFLIFEAKPKELWHVKELQNGIQQSQ